MLHSLYASFTLLILASCSTLRKAEDRKDRITLTDNTLNLLAGRYKTSSIVPGRKSEASLSGNIFDRGYNPKTGYDFIEIKVPGNNKLSVSYWDSATLIKSKVFKGRIKNDYFIFKRRYLVIPAIFANIYRNRMFRIGLLLGNNLITDYKQVSFGSFYVLLPFANGDQQFNIEFERLQ